MAKETSQKEFVSIPELTEKCGLSHSTLYRLAKANKLPGASKEAVEAMPRVGRVSTPRYQWVVHLETFLAWWTKYGEDPRNLVRFRTRDLPVAPQYTPAPQTAEADTRRTRTQITDAMIRRIGLARKDRLTAIQIRAMMIDIGFPEVPSLSVVRRIAQHWDDKNGYPHLEPKRNRLTNAEYAARKAALEAEAIDAPERDTVAGFPGDPSQRVYLTGGVQTYNHNIGDQVRMSNAVQFVCSECKKRRQNPERLSLSVVRPGRSGQKDIATHLLCSAICAIKFIECKEETEWNGTTLKRPEHPMTSQEITFPMPQRIPPPTSQNGSLWRRFRALVGGKG
mgnify:CR=1 FL=1|tara:strand:- start:208 stop:1218 length:1011 start_codon:yes stop_codon:yes gene_type:complete